MRRAGEVWSRRRGWGGAAREDEAAAGSGERGPREGAAGAGADLGPARRNFLPEARAAGGRRGATSPAVGAVGCAPGSLGGLPAGCVGREAGAGGLPAAGQPRGRPFAPSHPPERPVPSPARGRNAGIAFGASGLAQPRLPGPPAGLWQPSARLGGAASRLPAHRAAGSGVRVLALQPAPGCGSPGFQRREARLTLGRNCW